MPTDHQPSRRRRAGAWLASTLTATLLAGLTGWAGPAPGAQAAPVASSAVAPPVQPVVLGDDRIAPLAAALPRRAVTAAPTMRLAPGLLPPTNRWFSGLVFGAAPQPVFPYPLSFAQTTSGFTVGLPTVHATRDTIYGSAAAQLSVGVGADSARVADYDEVSVTLEHRARGVALGRTVIAEGSPAATYTSARPGIVTLGARPAWTSPGRGTVTSQGTTWGVVTTGATAWGPTLSLRDGATVTVFAVPTGTTPTELRRLQAAAANPLVGVTATHQAVSGGQRTTLSYRTSTGAAGLVVPLPHQGSAAAATGCTATTYATTRGDSPACASSTLSFTTPTVPASTALDLSGLTTAQRAELTTQLRRDVAALPTFAADTYFGGKSLYRAAMLLQLARQLGATAEAATLTSRLTTALDRWTDPRGCVTRSEQCFVYDPVQKGVVGLASSFGSDEFNDHHFHYGYFLFATGVVAQSSPATAARWRPVLDLLAADVASVSGGASGATRQGTTVPDRRVFDPYLSHSWAAGRSPFADGNNQESSSEAVTAWVGLSSWASATGDTALLAEATWLLSAETASALAYWVAPDLSAPRFDAYAHDLVSLEWGGKRDFATWFSARPSAIVGIQLIPMSPASGYLSTPAGGGRGHIASISAVALAEGTAAPLADYAVMYRSLAGPAEAAAALSTARALPAAQIDDGNSRTYLLAYVMSAARRTAS